VTAAALAARLRSRARRDPLLRSAREAGDASGARVLLVGGAVRDAALGRSAPDLDLVAVGRVPALVAALAGRWGTRGFRFRKRGVTTWRFRVDGQDVDLVDASRTGLETDLGRRDFTLNAIAFDLAKAEVVDPLRGLPDLRRGLLRLPRPGVIREDPLRGVRGARFVAAFGFRLHRDAAAEIAREARGLLRVSPERVRDELTALLVSADPRAGMRQVRRLGLLPHILPELVPLEACAAGRDRPDVWTHTLDALALAGDDPALRWSLLLHDVAKPDTLQPAEDDGRPTVHGHEVRGARRAREILGRLRFPRAFVRRVAALIAAHLRPHHLAEAGDPPRGIRRLVREMGSDLPLLLEHAACDARASGAPDARARWRRLARTLRRIREEHARAATAPTAPLLSGDEVMAILGIPPGPEVGRVLRELAVRHDDGEITTAAEARRWLSGGGGR